MSSLQQRLVEVRGRIADAATKAGRSANEIRLVVVTKGHPEAIIRDLYDLGVREFGESYIQEGIEKQNLLGPLEGLHWHMIGHVQSRKAEEAAQHFTMIHSVDNLKLVKRLDRFAGERNLVLPILLECNVSGEGSKFGWQSWDEKGWNNLLPEVEQLLQFPNVRVSGLMSMAPFLDDPEQARPYFARARHLRDYLANKFPRTDWSELSMGMSGDFEAAIKEGATMVRLGTAIVGERPPKVGE